MSHRGLFSQEKVEKLKQIAYETLSQVLVLAEEGQQFTDYHGHPQTVSPGMVYLEIVGNVPEFFAAFLDHDELRAD